MKHFEVSYRVVFIIKTARLIYKKTSLIKTSLAASLSIIIPKS